MASIILPTLAKTAWGWGPWGIAAAGIVGSLVDSVIISAITPGTTTESGKLSDLDYQTATLGAGIVKGYGTTKITGNIMWGTKFTEHISEETTGGGKGGGGASVTTKTYTYSASFAILICEGEINSISKVYADGTEFDLSSVDYRLYKGTESQIPDDFMESIEGEGRVPAYRGIAYIVFRNMNLSDYGNRIPSFSFVVAFPKNDLKEIMDEISVDAGLVLTQDVDTTALAGITVDGFTRSGGQSYKDQVNSLRVCNDFDGAERYGIVVFKGKDFNNVVQVAKTDYGAYETEPEDNPIETTTAHDLSLPKKLTVNYVSKANDYQTGTAQAYRQITGANTETSVSTEQVMTDSAAKSVAEKRLFEAWEGRTTHEFKLGNKYGWVMPGDILEVALLNGDKQLMQITSTNYGRPGLNVVKAVNVNSGVYTIPTRVVDTPPAPIVVAPSAVSYGILDIPLLPLDDTSNSDTTIYFVSGGTSYYGANIYRSYDEGVSYRIMAQNNKNGVIGTAATVLGDAEPWTWDWRNTVTVNVPYGTLQSDTEDNLLNFANMAILGNEIIQYRFAELISEGVYALSGLLRGRNGTEMYTGSHAAGERFIVLGKSSVNGVSVSADNWYKEIPLKIGPRNRGILDELYASTSFTPQGIMSKPWAGCQLVITKDGLNWHGEWKRRARKNGVWKDYSDVPLGENIEAYDIDVLNSAGEVIATFATSTTMFDYTGPAKGFNIYQISDARGRGWPLEWRE